MSESLATGKPLELVTERRRQLFVASARVFAAKGYHNATINEIAREAGLGKGTIYEYVRSKKDLLLLVVEEGHKFILEQVEELVGKNLPADQKLKGAIHIQLQVLDEYSEAANAILPEVLGLEDEYKSKLDEIGQRYINCFGGIYEEGVRTGVFREMDAFIVSELLCNLCIIWGKSPFIKHRLNDSVAAYEELLFDVISKGIMNP